MDIGFLIPPSDCSSAPASSCSLSEKGQLQQPAQSGIFSALLKDQAQPLTDEQILPISNAGDPIEPALLNEAVDPATGAVLSGIAVASYGAMQDLPETACPVADNAVLLEGSTGIQLQSMVVVHPDDRTMGTELLPVDLPKPVIADPSINPLSQPVLGIDRSGETPVGQEGPRMMEELPVRNGRSATAQTPTASIEQPPGNPSLPAKAQPGHLMTDQEPAPVMENQTAKIVLSTASVNAVMPSPDRPPAGIQPLGMVQLQGTHEAPLPGQSLAIPVLGDSEGGDQDQFGTDSRGAGSGTFFRSGESGTPEPVTRGNQPQLFNGQFTSAVQAQSSMSGERASVATPPADRLKMTQALFGEDRSAAVTAAAGKVQSVHVELPSHDSGPLSVRISMTDQMVHTQFTTDRNDLGALLFARQDQLQQSLAKSGLDLGQFQVHIDQRGQQESLPDRQPRRNGDAPEQQPASQDRDRQAHDRERPDQRTQRALSLFA
jgi:hypothetical protein